MGLRGEAPKLTDDAEEGFDVDEILRRRGGRPAMGSAPASAASTRYTLSGPDFPIQIVNYGVTYAGR